MKKKNQTSATNRYLLAGLSLFCILMMVFSSFSDKVSGPFKVLADYTVIPLQQGINHVGGWLGDLSDNFETLQQLRAENARHQAEAEARKRDETWNNIKAAVELPAGWLGDREPETRALYENNKDLFFVQLIQHNAKLPHNNTAQGKCTCGTMDNVAETKTALEEVRKSTGFRVKMEEE